MKQARLDALKLASVYTSDADEAIIIASEFAYFIENGDRVRPGTSKGDAYCARSAGQMQKHPKAAKNPNSPLRLSRKRWKCAGTKSTRA